MFQRSITFLLALAPLLARADTPASSSPEATDFRRDILPIFAEWCHSCHGFEKQKNGLRLDRRVEALRGGDSGLAIMPGKSGESRLFRYIAGLDPEIIMPPKGERLSTNQIASIKAWIDAGALWPDDPADDGSGVANHWAFVPPKRPPLPKIRNPKLKVRNPTDAFVAAEQQKLKLVPSPEASRRVLIRRLSLDLTGLPPTPEEISSFLNDDSPAAYEKLVEQLLASPHYGERWGRHWLDLARWAETEGYEANAFRSSAWRYRDYVVGSFNQDKPYDQFLREQIAGDELVPYSDDNLIATGFLAAGRFNSNEEDKAIQRNESLVDIVNATASVTLGLTLNCAQCHDHKFDPLTIRDYYRFQGFFIKGQVNHYTLKDPQLWKTYDTSIPVELETARTLRKQLVEPVRTRLVEEARKKLSPEMIAAFDVRADQRAPDQAELAKKAEKELDIPRERIEKALGEDDQKLLKELEKKISRMEKELDERKPQTWAFYSPASSPNSVDALPPRGMYPLPYEPQKLKEAKPRLLKRGDSHRSGAELEPGWPEVFQSHHPSPRSPPLGGERTAAPPPSVHNQAGGDSLTPSEGEKLRVRGSRIELVDWLTSPVNPLAARVWVNYVWQQHFGRGIVATSGDFGLQGATPTHSDLLDWLATELVRSGWSTKHLQRLIVLSSTYRQASQASERNTRLDPENKFLWRWSPRRLEAEVLRDAALRVSGELDPAPGGASVAREAEAGSVRRSLYLRQKRHDFPPAQALFDGPTGNESCSRRHVSTVSLQPLYLLNSEFMLKRAEAFARRVLAEAGDDERRLIETAFLLALGREPDEDDLRAAKKLVAAGSPDSTSSETRTTRSLEESESGLAPGMVRLCHALLNLNEFVYLE